MSIILNEDVVLPVKAVNEDNVADSNSIMDQNYVGDFENDIPMINNDQHIIKAEPASQSENIFDKGCIATSDDASVTMKMAGDSECEVANIESISPEPNSDQREDEISGCPMITSSFRLVQCDFCFSCFSSQHDFNIHRESCDGHIKSAFTCSICSVVFDTKEKLENHVICHEVSRPFSCRMCGSLFKQKKQLQQHVCSQKVANLICNICGLGFTKLSSLKNHIKIHCYQPGRDLVVPTFCETVLSDNNSWASESHSLTPLMPQLEMSSGTDISNWNTNLSLNDNLENKEVHDPMNISQEINVNTSYTSILDSHTFHNEFENIDEVSVHSDSGELKHHYEIYTQENNKFNNDEKHNIMPPQIQTTNDPEPKRNLENEVKRKPHTCKYCGVSFTREKALISHERFHQDCLTDIFECKKCGEVYLNKEDLRVHTCSKTYDKLYANEFHPPVQNHHTQNEKIVSLNNLELRTYESENIEYQGKDCSNLPTSPTLDSKQNKHVCEHCFKTFTTKQKKYRHMWIHRNKTFSCEVCADTFSTQTQLNQHRLSSHEGNTPHGCAICGKCFASRQGLWEHMRLHKEGSAPHQCNLCGKTFTSRQGYHIHARTHTGERPYGCRYCWKSFRDGGTLRKHERIHTGERPHVCPLCHRAFNQKVVLREHVRWLHAHHQSDQNQPFIPCPIPDCQHTLTDKEDLCAHIVKHSDTLVNFKQSSTIKHVKVKVRQKPITKAVKKDAFGDTSDDMYASPSDHRCEMCGEAFPHKDLLLSHVKVHI